MDETVVKVSQRTVSALHKVEFLYHAEAGKTVSVAGSFNDWTPQVSLMSFDPERKAYCIELELEPGCHEYKFVVDGNWILDETNPNFASNDFGTLNSVLNLE